MTINGVRCVFIPMCLFADYQFLPLAMKIKASGTLGWYVKRKFVSYKQIRNAVLKQANQLT
jgi:hypothetical protein